MSLCHKLWFSNPYIFATQVGYLWYFKFIFDLTSGCKDIKILKEFVGVSFRKFWFVGKEDCQVWKFEFVAMTQLRYNCVEQNFNNI